MKCKALLKIFLVLLTSLVFLPFSCPGIILDGISRIFTYLKLDEWLSFGIGGVGVFDKFSVGGVFEYSDLGGFTNYGIINDEFYYFLDSKKLEGYYGEIRLGYAGDFEVGLNFGVKYYNELVDEIIFSFDLKGGFKILDFLDTFVGVYSSDFAVGDMGYSFGFSIVPSNLGYSFIDIVRFSFDKKLLYQYLVGNVFASFKLFHNHSFIWYINFVYKYSFGIDVLDPICIGTDLEIGNFVVSYKVVLPFYFWRNFISISYRL